MRSDSVAALIVRLFGLSLFLYAIRVAPEVYLLYGDPSGAVRLVATLLVAGSFIVVGYLLYRFPHNVTRNLILDQEISKEKELTKHGILEAILLGVGVTFLFFGAVDAVYWIQLILVSSEWFSGMHILLNREQIISIITTCVEVSASIILIRYARCIAAALLR